MEAEVNDKGYVRVHRKILDNPIVMKDCEHLSIFIYLLLKATHTSIEQNFKGKAISLTKGQLITGREIISKELKVNSSKVQRVLSFFEKNKIIEQQTSNKNRLITIKNWDKYQFSEQQLNNKRTTTEQQLNTYNNYNNANNDNKKE